MDRIAATTNALIAVVIAMSLIVLMVVERSPSEAALEYELPAGPLPMVDDSQRLGFATAELKPLAAEVTARITYPWEDYLEDWTIQFVGGSGNVAGYTWSEERHIEIFVRPGDDAGSLARVLAHELGHAVDVTLNTGDERRSWLTQRNAETDEWWPSAGIADFSSGAGDFAETFAYWQLRDTQIRSQVAGTPTQADLALMLQLVRP